MKRLAILVLLLLSVGCNSSTKYGKCVGIDRDARDPNLIYEIDPWNVGMGIVFFEMVAPPAIILLTELYCPVGKK